VIDTTTAPLPRVVVMGVSGSGKSTIGALIAEALGVPFLDADSLHPRSNIEKMAAGHPLDDEDRWPWLAVVGRRLASAGEAGAVIACSALRRAYREAIAAEAPDVVFVHLDGPAEVLGRRLEGRSGHFMPPSLLHSQLAALEPLGRTERGVTVDISGPVRDVVGTAVLGVRRVVGIGALGGQSSTHSRRSPG
jgi:carbohydrate kinase (thermoresistant glucokinase family)